jgi:hypothetical protein
VGVEGAEHLGTVPPYGMDEVSTEPPPVLHLAIGMVEELDEVDPHRPGAGDLLLGPYPASAGSMLSIPASPRVAIT